MVYFWIGMVGGLAAFVHCLGMCGGLSLHLARPGGSGLRIVDQLLWHAGKTSSYVFLGALAGFLGVSLGAMSRLARAQDVVAWIAGGLMMLMGLKLLGLWPRRASSQERGGLLASLLAPLLRPPPTRRSAFLLGLATGFLPCPVVLGFLSFSLQSGSVWGGMLAMAGVGAGTLWALLLVGLFGRLLTSRLRRWAGPLGGVVLLLVGAVTVLRPSPAFHHLLGCPHSLVKRTAERFLPRPATGAATPAAPAR